LKGHVKKRSKERGHLTSKISYIGGKFSKKEIELIHRTTPNSYLAVRKSKRVRNATLLSVSRII
jgi:hypothetical protein